MVSITTLGNPHPDSREVKTTALRARTKQENSWILSSHLPHIVSFYEQLVLFLKKIKLLNIKNPQIISFREVLTPSTPQ
jgi:hypothetical protein